MRSARRSGPNGGHRPALEEHDMTATYTFDVFSSLDGYGAAGGNWTGYWGKQGPELLEHRLALYGSQQRMVFGANTYRQFARMLASSTEESEVRDPWVTRMWKMPATVVSTTLEEPLDWPDATVVSGDAVEVVARLKEESEVPTQRGTVASAAMNSAGRDGLNHDQASEGDGLRKLIVNASLALGGTASAAPDEARRETGAERSSSTTKGDR